MNRSYSPACVAVNDRKILSYPIKAPFSPSEAYPEYPLEPGTEKNEVYAGVRELFRQMELDREHFGLPSWNPLGGIVKEGETVVIKPNFVSSHHCAQGELRSIVTHPSVIRAVIDYVLIALKGKGRIVVADAPMPEVDFEKLKKELFLGELQKYYQETHQFQIEVYDLRQYRLVKPEHHPGEWTRVRLPGDPLGYTGFDLGEASSFARLGGEERLVGNDPDTEELRDHHTGGRHEYLIANTILTADTIISIPKMKTHGQAGVSLNIKNFVGAVGHKNYLPHYRCGDTVSGGDEYQRTPSALRRPLMRLYKGIWYRTMARLPLGILKKLRIRKPGSLPRGSGYWCGNDTLWRMVLDVFTLIEYGTKEGSIADRPVRKLFSVIDGISAGEGNGPLWNDEKKCGVLIAGDDLLTADLAAIRLMDFDCEKIPLYREMMKTRGEDWSAGLTLNSKSFPGLFDGLRTKKKPKGRERYLAFREPVGWRGKLRI